MEEPQAKRMQYFLKLIDKVLLEAANSIDPREAVIECYGEDASIFAGDSKDDGGTNDDDAATNNAEGGGGGTAVDKKAAEEKGREVLADLVRGTIDRVNDSIKSGILEVLDKEDVNSKMLKLERVIEEFEETESRKRKKEEDDNKLTDDIREKAAKLPKGMTPSDLVKYHEYKLKLEERDQLLAEIVSIEAENEAIERQIEKGKGVISKKLLQIPSTIVLILINMLFIMTGEMFHYFAAGFVSAKTLLLLWMDIFWTGGGGQKDKDISGVLVRML